jgi:Tfp pilus assembly protein PilP
MGLALGLGAWPAAAQEEPPAEAGDAAAEDIFGGDDVDVSRIDQILRGEQEVLEGEVFSYDPAGRRDPFRSLLDGFEEVEEASERPRPPGLPGMMIEELTLEGIIQTSSGILAFVQGRDNLSYIIRPGTKLYNGEVAEIEPRKVIFRQQVNDPKQLKPYQEVVRELAD